MGQPLHELCYLAFLHYLQPAHDEDTLSSGIPGEHFLSMWTAECLHVKVCKFRPSSQLTDNICLLV